MKAHCVACAQGVRLNVTEYEKEVQLNEDTNEEEEVVVNESTSVSELPGKGKPQVNVDKPKNVPTAAVFVPYKVEDAGLEDGNYEPGEEPVTTSHWAWKDTVQVLDPHGKPDKNGNLPKKTMEVENKIPAKCPNCGSPTLTEETS